MPKAHIPCIGAVPGSSELLRTISEAINIAERCFEREYRTEALTVFEHGIVGQTIGHAHFHLLPANLSFTERIRNDFPATEIEEIEGDESVPKRYARSFEPYLYWASRLDNKGWVCWNPPAPPQYLRTVAAKLLGRPERGDWHMMDPELDRKLWSETVRRLKPYFT